MVNACATQFASIATCNLAFSKDEGFCGFFTDQIGAALGIAGGVAVAYWIECACSGSGKVRCMVDMYNGKHLDIRTVIDNVSFISI